MRVVEIRGDFGLDHLTLAERPDPAPGPGQALVRVRAAALNYRDLLMVDGRYNRKQKLPLIPCSDGAGEVLAVGDGVTRVRPGDRVCGIFAQGWIAGDPSRDLMRTTLGGPLDGMLAEQVVLAAEGLVKVPDHLSYQEAATLPCAAVTAWAALVEGGLKAGQTVLLQGTGGVSIFALQLAVLAGAGVIITSSSDEKLARAREMGAAAGINYKQVPEWGARVKELTGGDGVDWLLEVGGAATLPQSLQAVRAGGCIYLIGVLSGNSAEISIPAIQMRRVRIEGVLVGSRAHFEALNRAVALHRLRPVVDRAFPLEEAHAAFEHMAAASHFGKICVSFEAPPDSNVILKDDDGTPKASLFYIAYTRDGIADPAGRPITFAFNGGPGTASLWVRLGAFGPKQVTRDPEGRNWSRLARWFDLREAARS